VTGEGYKIPTRYTHEQLATMIGCQRLAVTRAFAKLQDSGSVQLRRRYIHVLDLEVLKSFSETKRVVKEPLNGRK
jgi:CRP/FNR family cyclic AMP-dependent transcriptional regulator